MGIKRVIYIGCLLLLFLGGRAQVSGPVSFCVTDNAPKRFTLTTADWTDKSSVSAIEWDFGDGNAPTTAAFSQGTDTYTRDYTYKKRGSYVITVKALKNDGTEITVNRRTLRVKVNSCRLPVNHNITTMGY